MAFNTRLVTFLCLFLPIIFSSSTLAQNCSTDTFSSNELYSSCISLSGLNATLHWTYYSTNGTVNVAYRITESESTWVAWGINPNGTGMIGANAFLAYYDPESTQQTIPLQVITSQISSYSPTIANGNLTFPVYEMSVDYSNGAYTIYATLALPNNSTTLNTVWQRGTDFSNGVPSGHPNTATGAQQTNLNFLSGQSA